MQREQQSAAEEHTAELRTRRVRFDERNLNSIEQFATARKKTLTLPGENQFKANQLFLEQKSHHNCSFFAINPTLSYEWTAVKCSRRTDNVNFICEYKQKDILHLDKKSLVVESKCPFRMVLINNHCYLISQYTQDLHVQVSQTPDYFNESNFVLQRYLTAWTLSSMIDQNDESKHTTIIHKNTKNFLSPCGCWQTDTLFFWELKEWHALECPCANNVAKFQLTMVSPITSKNTACRADIYRQCMNGSCILNIYDCEDRDGRVCVTDESVLMCATGECLWISQICDGISDCEDSSDELSCRSEEIISTITNMQRIWYLPKCPNKWTRCNVYSNTCFPNDQICVYERLAGQHQALHCQNTEHLRYCRYHQCPTMYKCRDSYCIPTHMVCNGVADCPDMEDETNCSSLTCIGKI